VARSFRFRLEAVLKLRQQREDACQRVVAARLREIAAAERQLAVLRTESLDETARLRTLSESSAASQNWIVQLRRSRAYLGFVQRSVAEQEAKLAELNGQLDAERGQLIEVAKQLKVVEKLRERHWRRHQEHERRAEAALADEAALNAFLANSRRAAPLALHSAGTLIA